MSINSTKPAVSGKHLHVIESEQETDSACPSNAIVAQIGREIVFDPKAMDSLDESGCRPLHYDLLVLCAAIELADRRWQRSQGWSRDLYLTVPVMEPHTWQRTDVLKSLLAVLRHVTCDNWHFRFIQAKNPSPFGSRQLPISFRNKSFVIAYSEGLDSRAVSAISDSKDQALRIRVANTRQSRKNGEDYFTQLPFKVKGYRARESSFRSRAFQFAAVTAIAAHISNLKRIIVPESGQGALGPVLLPIYRIPPDYRSHPVFFRKMEQFVNQALGHEVHFEQPRLWSTKGETLRVFLDLPNRTKGDLVNTRSCWMTRSIVNIGGRRKQCGLCAACLLRRLSLHTAGVDEPEDTYVVKDLSAPNLNQSLSEISRKSDRDIMVEYGSLGTLLLHQLADMASLPDEALRPHVWEIAEATDASFQDTLNNLRDFLNAHAEEWRTFISAQGEQSFLNSWIDGGDYDRSK
ncbi:MAG: 7-cyano-7-deazaguanine synthase [Cyanobacteria bacterium HKST-UBA02]|nr:7-cyano-7-deazaguanine synthase [Cyanobacteria bacterium HKST-UBA02]